MADRTIRYYNNHNNNNNKDTKISLEDLNYNILKYLKISCCSSVDCNYYHYKNHIKINLSKSTWNYYLKTEMKCEWQQNSKNSSTRCLRSDFNHNHWHNHNNNHNQHQEEKRMLCDYNNRRKKEKIMPILSTLAASSSLKLPSFIVVEIALEEISKSLLSSKVGDSMMGSFLTLFQHHKNEIEEKLKLQQSEQKILSTYLTKILEIMKFLPDVNHNNDFHIKLNDETDDGTDFISCNKSFLLKFNDHKKKKNNNNNSKNYTKNTNHKKPLKEEQNQQHQSYDNFKVTKFSIMYLIKWKNLVILLKFPMLVSVKISLGLSSIKSFLKILELSTTISSITINTAFTTTTVINHYYNCKYSHNNSHHRHYSYRCCYYDHCCCSYYCCFYSCNARYLLSQHYYYMKCRSLADVLSSNQQINNNHMNILYPPPQPPPSSTNKIHQITFLTYKLAIIILVVDDAKSLNYISELVVVKQNNNIIRFSYPSSSFNYCCYNSPSCTLTSSWLLSLTSLSLSSSSMSSWSSSSLSPVISTISCRKSLSEGNNDDDDDNNNCCENKGENNIIVMKSFNDKRNRCTSDYLDNNNYYCYNNINEEITKNILIVNNQKRSIRFQIIINLNFMQNLIIIYITHLITLLLLRRQKLIILPVTDVKCNFATDTAATIAAIITIITSLIICTTIFFIFNLKYFLIAVVVAFAIIITIILVVNNFNYKLLVRNITTTTITAKTYVAVNQTYNNNNKNNNNHNYISGSNGKFNYNYSGMNYNSGHVNFLITFIMQNINLMQWLWLCLVCSTSYKLNFIKKKIIENNYTKFIKNNAVNLNKYINMNENESNEFIKIKCEKNIKLSKTTRKNTITYNKNNKFFWINRSLLGCFILALTFGCCTGIRQEVSTNCTFPERWEGAWFLSGYQQSIHIKGSLFSYRGKCIASDGNKYLIVDERGCHRCLVIYEKHVNVLQYKESECDGDSYYMDQTNINNPAAMPIRSIINSDRVGGAAHPNSRYSYLDPCTGSYDDPSYCKGREVLQNLCDQIPGDALLYSLFREQADPVKCPLRGPYTFTYNRGHGECKNPVSNIDSCTEESRLLLSFQACPDVQGTESTVEELTCLATWKDGNSRYLVGLVSHHHAISNEDRFRCFVYEKIFSTMIGAFSSQFNNPNLKDAEYKLAQSGDATCNGLDSAEVGSRIMTLRKPPPAERCDFPIWLKEPRHWYSLKGNFGYQFHSSDGSMHISRPNGYTDTRAFCEQINKQTTNEMTAVVHFTSGCKKGFMCMTFYRRDIHIAEIQMGQPASRLEEACLPDHFDISRMSYVTLLASNSEATKCPADGLYHLLGAIGPPNIISRHKRNHNNNNNHYNSNNVYRNNNNSNNIKRQQHNQHGHHHQHQQHHHNKHHHHHNQQHYYYHNNNKELKAHNTEYIIHKDINRSENTVNAEDEIHQKRKIRESPPQSLDHYNRNHVSRDKLSFPCNATNNHSNTNSTNKENHQLFTTTTTNYNKELQQLHKLHKLHNSFPKTTSSSNIQNNCSFESHQDNYIKIKNQITLKLSTSEPPILGNYQVHYQSQHLIMNNGTSDKIDSILNKNNLAFIKLNSSNEPNELTNKEKNNSIEGYPNQYEKYNNNYLHHRNHHHYRSNHQLKRNKIHPEHHNNQQHHHKKQHPDLQKYHNANANHQNFEIERKSIEIYNDIQQQQQQSQRNRRDVPGCSINYKIQRQLRFGCTDFNQIDVRPQCDEANEVYVCYGSWTENMNTYIVAKNLGTQHLICLTYIPFIGNEAKLVIGDECYHNSHEKQSEHLLMMNITRFGNCGDSSSAILDKINEIWPIILTSWIHLLHNIIR